MVAVSLILRRPFAEGALDTFAKLDLGSCPGALDIWEAFAAEVLNLWQEGLQLLKAVGDVFDGSRFRPGPL